MAIMVNDSEYVKIVMYRVRCTATKTGWSFPYSTIAMYSLGRVGDTRNVLAASRRDRLWFGAAKAPATSIPTNRHRPPLIVIDAPATKPSVRIQEDHDRSTITRHFSRTTDRRRTKFHRNLTIYVARARQGDSYSHELEFPRKTRQVTSRDVG